MKPILAAVVGLTALAGAGSARATAIFTFSQVGSNVVGTLSGSLNLTGAVFDGTTPSYNPRMDPILGYVNATPAAAPGLSANVYEASGPNSFGTGFSFTGTATGSGPFEIINGDVILPTNYSGGPLDNTLTIANRTFSSMGIVLGSYTYTITGSGDEVIVRFVTAVGVPEPSTLALFGIAGAMLIGLRVRPRDRRGAE
jgi:hypothetical protein